MRFSFSRINRVKKEEREPKWLATSPLGTLVLLGGVGPCYGGYLRIADTAWILLSPAQAHMGAWIPWPYTKGIEAIRITGEDLEIRQTGQQLEKAYEAFSRRQELSEEGLDETP